MDQGRKPFKLALISTHGTGKTTLSFDVAAQLKKRGLKVKVFSEIAARACEMGIPINEGTTLPAQLYILLQHMCEELRGAIRGYEVVICDRSVFDNWIYLERRCGRDDNGYIIDFIRMYADQFPYDAIYKLPLVGDLVDDGIREVFSKDFQEDVYSRLNNLLTDLRVQHKTLPMPTSVLRSEWCDLIVEETMASLQQRGAGAINGRRFTLEKTSGKAVPVSHV
ncbi:MAG: AAA family ATPase [Elusimicrobiota bacterium]